MFNPSSKKKILKLRSVTSKTNPWWSFEASNRDFLSFWKHFSTVSTKGVNHGCFNQGCVNQGCQPRVSTKGITNNKCVNVNRGCVNQRCQLRVSTKGVNQGCQPRVSTKGVNQGCQPCALCEVLKGKIPNSFTMSIKIKSFESIVRFWSKSARFCRAECNCTLVWCRV